MVCPKLEELILVPHNLRPNIWGVVKMARVRASRGVKLRTIRIVCGRNKFNPGAELELRKHVLHVEYGPEADAATDNSDEED